MPNTCGILKCKTLASDETATVEKLSSRRGRAKTLSIKRPLPERLGNYNRRSIINKFSRVQMNVSTKSSPHYHFMDVAAFSFPNNTDGQFTYPSAAKNGNNLEIFVTGRNYPTDGRTAQSGGWFFPRARVPLINFVRMKNLVQGVTQNRCICIFKVTSDKVCNLARFFYLRGVHYLFSKG